LPVEVQRVLLAEIERHVATARAGLEADLADVQADREALAEELERQAAALQAAERRVAEQAAELERHAGALEHLERGLSEAREQVVREREAAENARKAAALAELRTESLPRLHAEIETLQNKLDEEREARRKAEIEAAELRGPQHGKKG
jgi:phage-related tail protein